MFVQHRQYKSIENVSTKKSLVNREQENGTQLYDNMKDNFK